MIRMANASGERKGGHRGVYARWVDELTRDQLLAFREVAEVARTFDCRCGSAVAGRWTSSSVRVTRAHEDVDWFAWHHDLPALVEALAGRGWVECVGPPADEQRDLARGDVEMSLAALAEPAGDIVVAGGPRAGTAWPPGMIRDAVDAELRAVCCAVIRPAVQVEIKQMMPV